MAMHYCFFPFTTDCIKKACYRVFQIKNLCFLLSELPNYLSDGRVRPNVCSDQWMKYQIYGAGRRGSSDVELCFTSRQFTEEMLRSVSFEDVHFMCYLTARAPQRPFIG
jgi:hypothetical protein